MNSAVPRYMGVLLQLILRVLSKNYPLILVADLGVEAFFLFMFFGCSCGKLLRRIKLFLLGFFCFLSKGMWGSHKQEIKDIRPGGRTSPERGWASFLSIFFFSFLFSQSGKQKYLCT